METRAVTPGREALGTAIEAAGNFTGWKGFFKYTILFTALWARREHGNPLENDEISAAMEPGWFNLGYPLSVFIRHVNSISVREAAIEGVTVLAAGLLFNVIGRKVRGEKIL